VRPPEGIYPDIELKYLLHETTVVALPADHPLTALDVLSVSDLIDVPLIVPARRARPQSYDLTMKLFAEAGMRPRIAQQADEKQTIVSLVAAGAGSAIVPRWTSRMMGQGWSFARSTWGPARPTGAFPGGGLASGSRDHVRDQLLGVLTDNLARYARDA
jgi:DNA-binding transcriptional LysR family regulator